MKDYFFHGKFFDTMEEMLDYARKWPESPVDLEWFKTFLDQRYQEAILNAQMNPEFDNIDLFRMLRVSTDWVDKSGEQ